MRYGEDQYAQGPCGMGKISMHRDHAVWRRSVCTGTMRYGEEYMYAQGPCGMGRVCTGTMRYGEDQYAQGPCGMAKISMYRDHAVWGRVHVCTGTMRYGKSMHRDHNYCGMDVHGGHCTSLGPTSKLPNSSTVFFPDRLFSTCSLPVILKAIRAVVGWVWDRD